MPLTKPRAAQIYNLDYKQSTRVITASNITLAGGAPNSVDGVTLSLGDRVLVTGQTTGSQNGLYLVTTLGSGANGTWARTSDGNETGEIEAGMIVMVTEGTIYADTQWKLITNDPIVIGTTALTFTQNYMANSISGGTSNVVVNSNANVTISSAGTANVLTISSTGTVTSGTGSVTGNITGGNIFTVGIMSSTGNGTHGNILTGGLVSSTGNIITAGNISAVGTIYSNGAVNSTAFAVGNSAVSNVALGMFPTAGTSGEYAIRDYSTVFSHIYFDVGIGGTANGAFQFRSSNAFRLFANINSSGITTPLAVSATGNITGNYFIGNGSQLTGIVASAGAAITNGTSNVVVAASGNVTVGVAGTASVATFTTVGIIANSVATTNNGNAFNFKVGDDAWLGDINTADTIGIRGQQNAANAYIVFGNADSTALGRAGSGPLTYGGAFSATGNVTGGNILTGGLISATGTITSAGNLSLTGNIVDIGELWINTSANGNINLNPNGTGSTNIPVGVLSVTGNIQGGNLRTAGLISATGNVTGGNILTAGLISATSTITSSANITGGNILTAGLISATSTITSSANITGGNILTAGIMSSTGNGIHGNILTGGLVSATGAITGSALTGTSLTVSTGNVTAGNLLLSGAIVDSAQLDIQTSAANANIAMSPNGTGVVTVSTQVSAVGNVTGGNIRTAGLISATSTITSAANVIGGNITTAGLISATSTITSAANVIGGNISTAGLITATGNIQGGNLRTAGLISATGAITGAAITGTSLTVSTGNITAGNIVNANANGVGNIGSATTYFNTVFARATSAQYADLAEKYTADADYTPGTVIEFGGNEEVTISTQSHSTRVAGIVSTNPSYLMNAAQAGKHVIAVALTGRVPCSVVGTIAKGDRLVASDQPGVAQPLDKNFYEPGCIIGKALESYNSNQIGTIEVAVGRF